jgi:predicted transcriptional regulator
MLNKTGKTSYLQIKEILILVSGIYIWLGSVYAVFVIHPPWFVASIIIVIVSSTILALFYRNIRWRMKKLSRIETVKGLFEIVKENSEKPKILYDSKIVLRFLEAYINLLLKEERLIVTKEVNGKKVPQLTEEGLKFLQKVRELNKEGE